MSHHFKRNPDVSWQVVDGQAVLIHNRMGEIMVLNEVGSEVWKNLEKGIEGITEVIVENFDVNKETAQKDVEEFINELIKVGAVTES